MKLSGRWRMRVVKGSEVLRVTQVLSDKLRKARLHLAGSRTGSGERYDPSVAQERG